MDRVQTMAVMRWKTLTTRSLFSSLGSVFLMLGQASAEPVRLTCVPDDPGQDWRASVTFDVETWTFSWGEESWELVAADERSLAARWQHKNWPVAVVIDRETGRFWRSDMGSFCTSGDCTRSQLGGVLRTGRCFTSF